MMKRNLTDPLYRQYVQARQITDLLTRNSILEDEVRRARLRHQEWKKYPVIKKNRVQHDAETIKTSYDRKRNSTGLRIITRVENWDIACQELRDFIFENCIPDSTDISPISSDLVYLTGKMIAKGVYVDAELHFKVQLPEEDIRLLIGLGKLKVETEVFNSVSTVCGF